MRKAILAGLYLALVSVGARANVYTFAPTPGNLGNLDHNSFYTWGINWAVPQGQTITSATLSFTQIWDWRVEPDSLFIHLLDTAPAGVSTWTDNEGGGDFFISSTFKSLGVSETKIGEWTDPFGGDPSKAQNVTFTFNAAQLTALQGYINNGGPNGYANFGFGFDPDCHYYNNGVNFQITTKFTAGVPEGGSSFVLLGSVWAGVACLHRLFRVRGTLLG